MRAKFLHIIVIFALVLTIAIPSKSNIQSALADTSDLKVTGTILHLREGPGLSYPIITTLEEGDPLTSINREGDWIQVKTGNYEGWVASWLTAPTNAKQTIDQTLISQVDRLNIRTEPDISSAVLGQLSTGNQANLIEKNGEWAKIDWNGLVGWVSTDYVTINDLPEKKAEADEPKVEVSTKNVNKDTTFTVLVDTLNVRKDPDLNAKKIGTVSKGQAYKVLAQEHNWVQIQYNDKKAGWVYSFYGTFSNKKTTSKSSSSSELESVTIIYNGTNLRTDATTAADVVERVDAGETYPIVGAKDDFYEIQVDDKTAFVANWVVTTTSSSKAATATKEEKPKPRKKGTLNGLTIVVDAGHGGNDHGTTGQRGTNEKEITLKTASLLASKLSAAGANVIMTRESDEYVALRKRVSIAHQYEADAFISIHYDATDDSSINGFTSYYMNNNQQGLAEAINAGLSSKIDLKDRGTQQGNYLVLRENRQKAVLIELGFLSNASEERFITTAKFREQASLGIYQGILNYFNENQ
ncbi:N-acetylmuramoyl-L-alanine amidase [Lysinibacillus agricola]|uniref:N-acetylmuramoyl-L-alanine amidase n=1 Tax=Lysinibacillus agricola TaxID=2590012 RepID=A0ABX7APM9_9BACI|nr:MULTISPECIES: N-acetylmuramoyl-L-alanine amidase [Lysinibacillus]KOS60964.1 N-acetylmuramoyl-L-alanine amidase [Lysinibacillus sp. FJAT-14222]QQP11482.1 N-acetylmuramoyl-L-alanine amidase [Lysinibacillus agricola]